MLGKLNKSIWLFHEEFAMLLVKII